MVHAHRERSLDAYLLLLGAEPALDDRPFNAAVWARALTGDTAKPVSRQSVSRIWRQLENHNLIERERRQSHAWVRPRREDGQAYYVRPGLTAENQLIGGQWPKDDFYFVIPHEYWIKGYDQSLSLAGKAMLLIALQATSSNQTFYLPVEKAQQWYGVSAETVQRGLRALRDAHLLSERYQKIKAPLAPEGVTTRTHYSLTGAFSTEGREKLQKATRTEVAKKAAASAKTISSRKRRRTPAGTSAATNRAGTKRRREGSPGHGREVKAWKQ